MRSQLLLNERGIPTTGSAREFRQTFRRLFEPYCGGETGLTRPDDRRKEGAYSNPRDAMTFDTISVHDLELRGRHGVYEEERSEGRRFAFDVEVDVPAGSLGANDNLGRTVDYREIARIVVEVVDGPSVHLIETLAEDVCARVLRELPVVRVRLTLRKFATGVPGDPAWVGLRIERSKT